MKTKPLSRIIYAYSVTTLWVAIEKYMIYGICKLSLFIGKNAKNRNQIIRQYSTWSRR